MKCLLLLCILCAPLVAEYSELKWLKGENIAATADYASQAFDTEYKRTKLTLKCLDWILNGDYVAFTGNGKNHLELESFGELTAQAQYLKNHCPFGLTSSQVVDVMHAALVLGDIGKTPKARDLFPELEAIHDHDEFYKEALRILEKKPERCPTFDRLPPRAQRLLLKTSHFAHYGHICHVEGGPSMLAGVANICTEDELYCLNFDLFIQRCDVAGAAGHVNNTYSIVYSNNVHYAMEGVAKACQAVAENKATEKQGLMQYLRYRGQMLDLNADDQKERILIRLACMLRLFTKDEGAVLKAAVKSLDPDMITGFDPLLEREGPTPTYMPAVLGNLKRHHDLPYAVKFGLPAIAKILVACPEELNFNPLAAQINQNPCCLEDAQAVQNFILENRAPCEN